MREALVWSQCGLELSPLSHPYYQSLARRLTVLQEREAELSKETASRPANQLVSTWLKCFIQ